MSLAKDEEKTKKIEATLEEALNVVGSGVYTNFLAFVGGLLTLSAMASMQCMYYILPAVGCELALGPAELGFLASTPFIGSMLSASWFGFLVDQYGRRRILLITTIGSSCGAIVGSFAPNLASLMCFSFCTGFMLGGVFGNPYVYVSEFCPLKIRSDKLIIIAIVASFSNTFSPCVAWLVMSFDISVPISHILNFTSWRLFLIMNTIPMLVAAFLLLNLPESPKYLLSKGKPDEALDSLMRLYAVNNKKSKESFPVTGLKLEFDDVVGSASSNSDKHGGFMNFILTMLRQLKELFSPPLLIYTIICSLMKFAVIGLYSVIYLWLPEEANRLLKYSETHEVYDVSLCDVMAMDGYQKWGKCDTDKETYLVSITVGVTYSIGCLIMIYLVRTVQLKVILGANIMLAGAICFVMLFFKTLVPTLASLGLITAILAATQPAVYGIIVHFFPTPLRATATAVCVVFGRLAVPIGSSLFGAAFHSHCMLAYWSLAAILGVIGVVCFLTPNKKALTADP